MRRGTGAAAWLLATLAPVSAVAAQPIAVPAVAATGSRAGENAVRQAGDAFGTSIGREVTGLYNQGRVRGFSPIVAGNVRIDGMYFDPVALPGSRISRSTTIRVGLSALGNPFPAPTGLVDFGFRRPGDRAAASMQVGADVWGAFNAEIDAVVPVAESFSLGVGASTYFENSFNSTRENGVGGAIIARTTATSSLSRAAIWSAFMAQPTKSYALR